jgi:membrane protein
MDCCSLKGKDFVSMIRVTYQKWRRHNPSQRAGALTFFMIMPLPSLMLIVVAFFAQIYGEQQALQQFLQQVSIVAGPSVANLVSQLLESAQNPFTSLFGSFFSIVFAVAGAIGAFSVLQDSIDVIWETKKAGETGLGSGVRKDFGHFFLISVVGFVVMVWSGLSTVFFEALVFVLEPLFGGLASVFLGFARLLLSFGLGILLFAIIFKHLPDREISWRDVVLAAGVTSLVFTVLNYFFGIYLDAFPVTTVTGAAGSLMLLLLWVYLTNLAVLFGVQLSKTYVENKGSMSEKVKDKSSHEPERQIIGARASFEFNVKIEGEKSREMDSS